MKMKRQRNSIFDVECVRKQLTAIRRWPQVVYSENRGERIRTSDLSVPNRAHYQAVLRPDTIADYTRRTGLFNRRFSAMGYAESL